MRSSVNFLVCIFCLTITKASITFPHGAAPNPENITDQEAPAPEKVNEVSDNSVRGMAHSVANLGLRTLRDLLTNDSNVILSPINIFTCLGILDLGAVGETREEIRSLIGPPNENQKVDEVLGVRNDVSSAFAVFFDHQYAPSNEFVNTVMSDFRASVLSINSSYGEEAKSIINGWVKDHTNGTITDLLQDRVSPDSKIVLVSTLVFKGKWRFPFPPQSTFLDSFAVDEKTTVETEFMRMSATVPILRNLHFDAISLPYQDEKGLSMHFILPKTHGIPAMKKLLSHLNTNSLKKLRKESVNEEIILLIPRLKLEGRFSLMNTLRNQGIHLAFDPFKANFSGFVDGESDLYVAQMYHSIHFEMDEEGTSASAATAFVVNKRTMYTFRANRPFIFIITDNSDIVLFMGAIVNPT